jgi:hypothetical protein
VDVLDANALGHLIAPGLGIASRAVAGLWFGRHRGVNVLPLLTKIVVSALLAARFAFVLRHHDSYRGAATTSWASSWPPQALADPVRIAEWIICHSHNPQKSAPTQSIERYIV